MTGREDEPPGGREDGQGTGGAEQPGPGGPDEPDFDLDAFEKAFADEFGHTAEPERPEGAARPDGGIEPSGIEPGGELAEARGEVSPTGRRIIAVVLTPIRSAAALAGLCAMGGIDAEIIPSKNGALAVRVLPPEAADDAEMLLTGAPAAATELASTLSRTAKAGVVLLTAQLGEGDEGLTGTITGRNFLNGDAGEEVPAGLILANADDVLESLLLGTLAPADAPGRVTPESLGPTWRAGRLFNKTRRRKRP